MKTFKTELGICLVSFYNWCQKNYLHFHKSAAIVVAMAVSAVVTYPVLVFSRLLYSEGNWPLGIVLNPPNPLPNSNLYPLMTPFKPPLSSWILIDPKFWFLRLFCQKHCVWWLFPMTSKFQGFTIRNAGNRLHM